MYDYMEYIVRCFDALSGWDRANLYLLVVATPYSILHFKIPQGVSVRFNKKLTAQLANSFGALNVGSMSGSLAYFYSLSDLRNVLSSQAVSLQQALETYQFVDSVGLGQPRREFPGAYLMYGKLNFPSNVLEALLVKNFSANSRVLVKCLSGPGLIKNNGIITLFYQKNYPKYSWELIYSSNENLVGFRNLFNIALAGGESAEKAEKVFYDNSRLSIGTELWWGINNMAPGISNSLRYSTYSTYTGNPLTITLSCNPIIGLISATYTVKTTLNSTFCSKYDFNVYSYESDFSLGFEFWKFKNKKSTLQKEIQGIVDEERSLKISEDFRRLLELKGITNAELLAKSQTPVEIPRTHLSNIEMFKKLYEKLRFSSVFRASTSLNERNLKVLWEGKYNDFLIELGCSIQPLPNSIDNEKGLDLGQFGVSLQYSL